MPDKRTRLDILLARRGLAATRSQARDLVRRGQVRVAGRLASKAGEAVDEAAEIVLADGATAGWVSRGADKLAAALDVFGLDAEGRAALDIGASTGGFSELLLARGATRIHAVDVGTGQLHERLRSHPRVVPLEGLDARALRLAHVAAPVGAIVADVSFISLTLVLPAALQLAAPGCWLVALIKPQFEAGRDAIGKGGIVRDMVARKQAIDKVRGWLERQPGWTVLGVVPSPIPGKGGNLEYLIGAVHGG